MALHPQAGIDDRVEHVDQRVDDDEEESDEEQVGRHHRDIDETHRLDEEQAHARPLEHRLGDDGEGDERADLQAGHGDDRHQRVAKARLVVDVAPRQAAGPGVADVVVERTSIISAAQGA